MTDRRLALVTGAGGGIGEATARRLSSRGFHVLAGVRKPEDADKLGADGIEPITLDITKQEDIARLVERVTGDPVKRRLSVVVNNAAVPLATPAELVPLDAWRRNFEVNLFGHVAVTSALIPALAAAGESRLVNMSSMAAVLAGPSFGPYAVAKRALETYSDISRRELGRSGIKVIVIQPSSVKTPGWAQGSAVSSSFTQTMTPGQHARYDALNAAVIRTTDKWSSNGVPASAAAKVIVDAIEQKNPHARYRIGSDAKMITGLMRVLGDRSMDRLLNRMLGLK